jgi:hypothetical protein
MYIRSDTAIGIGVSVDIPGLLVGPSKPLACSNAGGVSVQFSAMGIEIDITTGAITPINEALGNPGASGATIYTPGSTGFAIVRLIVYNDGGYPTTFSVTIDDSGGA